MTVGNAQNKLTEWTEKIPGVNVSPEKICTQVGNAAAEMLNMLVSLVGFIGVTASSSLYAIRHPKKIRWRETLYYMSRCGVDGMPITVLICFLMGVILAYQSALQMHKYGADVFLPMLVGCTICRELGPLMVAVVATGRSGSAFAAEIASMKVSEELDAIVTLGFDPARFLVIPKLIAMVLMIPLLTILGDAVGVIGGFFVGKIELGMSFDTYLQITRTSIAPKYFLEGIVKSFIFAWLITVIGCWRGFDTGNDAIAVGQSTTSAVVSSILFIVLSDAILAKIFSVFYAMGM